MKSFNDAFDFVVGAEGGFGNDRHDRGNWDTGIVGDGNLKGTKFGISAMSYPGLDIKKLTLEDARKIYYDDYWHPMRCHLISYPKGLCLFDSAVNQGKRRASRFAQKSAGVTDDGIIGNQTLDALHSIADDMFVDLFLGYREYHYRSLSTFDRYGKGWLNRLEHVRSEALAGMPWLMLTNDNDIHDSPEICRSNR